MTEFSTNGHLIPEPKYSKYSINVYHRGPNKPMSLQLLMGWEHLDTLFGEVIVCIFTSAYNIPIS